MSDRPTPEPRRLEKVRLIGRGNFGAVYLVRQIATGELLVLKQLTNISPEEREAAENEVKLLQLLSHPNIINYYGCSANDGQFNIIMEYAKGGDLHSRILNRRGQHLSESEIMFLFVQIVSALKHVHDNNILHRDLKTQNIFLTDNDVVKLGDFGISKQLGTHNDFARTSVGTPYYLSPEQCEDRPYNSKSDIWSLGCILYELCALRHAFVAKSIPALVMSILRGIYEPIPALYSQDLSDLVKWLLSSDPDDRPTIDELAQSEFVRKWSGEFLKKWEEKGQNNVQKIKIPKNFEDGKGMETWKKEKHNQLQELESLMKAHRHPSPSPLNHYTPPQRQPPPPVRKHKGRELRRESPLKKEEVKEELRQKRRHRVASKNDMKDHEKKFIAKLKNVKSRISKPSPSVETKADSKLKEGSKKESEVTPVLKEEVGEVSSQGKSRPKVTPKAPDSGLRAFIQKKKKEKVQKDQNEKSDIEILIPTNPPIQPEAQKEKVNEPVVEIFVKEPETSNQDRQDEQIEKEDQKEDEQVQEADPNSSSFVEESSVPDTAEQQLKDKFSDAEEYSIPPNSAPFEPRGISPTPDDFNRCLSFKGNLLKNPIVDDVFDDVSDDEINQSFNFQSNSGPEFTSPIHEQDIPGSTPLFQTEGLSSPPAAESLKVKENSTETPRTTEYNAVANTMKTMLRDEFQTCKEPSRKVNKSPIDTSSIVQKIEELRDFCERQLGLDAFITVYGILKQSDPTLLEQNWVVLEDILGDRIFLLGCIQRILTLEGKLKD
ncbi:hypothetical protein P9112_003101 [Eukaryota sp. TZLM1-RC]